MFKAFRHEPGSKRPDTLSHRAWSHRACILASCVGVLFVGCFRNDNTSVPDNSHGRSQASSSGASTDIRHSRRRSDSKPVDVAAESAEEAKETVAISQIGKELFQSLSADQFGTVDDLFLNVTLSDAYRADPQLPDIVKQALKELFQSTPSLSDKIRTARDVFQETLRRLNVRPDSLDVVQVNVKGYEKVQQVFGLAKFDYIDIQFLSTDRPSQIFRLRTGGGWKILNGRWSFIEAWKPVERVK